MVKLQGGNIKFILNPDKYPKSKFIRKIKAEKSGYIKIIDNYQIGMAALELGAGRKTKTDKIDPKAGIVFKVKLGDKITKGQVVAELHSQSMDKIKTAKELILSAITFSKQKTIRLKLIKKIIK
jgi:pyrimidine-nucleoside phosphorylase